MRVLQVISYLNPKIGGDVNVISNLSKQLVKKGHDVSILTTDFQFDKEFAKDNQNEGIEIIPFHCIINVSSFFYSPAMKAWVKENIKRFDLIHLHNYRSYQNNVIHHYAKKYNIPYILQAHGSVLPFFAKQRLKKLYDFIWGHGILRDASKVIALTTTEGEQYQTMGVKANKIEIVPNGIDSPKYGNLPEHGMFRKKYGINDDEKIILYLGRIHKIKGIDFLIRAFKQLTNTMSNIHLVIIGPDDGYYHTMIESITKNQLKEKITLTGFLDGAEKDAAYYDSDVFVYPSQYDIFGISPFEALQFDTPIIVSNRCGCGEFVKAANCGKVIQYNDTNDLIQNITLLLNNQKMTSELIENGKKFVADNLTWEKIVSKLEFVYEDCIRHV